MRLVVLMILTKCTDYRCMDNVIVYIENRRSKESCNSIEEAETHAVQTSPGRTSAEARMARRMTSEDCFSPALPVNAKNSNDMC